MTISKIFVQKRIFHYCEANWTWEDSNESFDDLVDELASKWSDWFKAVRIVEKTFNDETFKITEKTLRAVQRHYEGYKWVKGTVEEMDEQNRKWNNCSN